MLNNSNNAEANFKQLPHNAVNRLVDFNPNFNKLELNCNNVNLKLVKPLDYNSKLLNVTLDFNKYLLRTNNARANFKQTKDQLDNFNNANLVFKDCNHKFPDLELNNRT